MVVPSTIRCQTMLQKSQFNCDFSAKWLNRLIKSTLFSFKKKTWFNHDFFEENHDPMPKNGGPRKQQLLKGYFHFVFVSFCNQRASMRAKDEENQSTRVKEEKTQGI